ncbi:Mitogen-activated protein kinase kinase kinase 7 [Dissophora globulifera]|uniref:Mitogen-activated protein kinase kinase kinase 7 n=1 Tax=Dissophora globulifera TaxID=979702 RepID=A0A9P6UXC4_9FUNG|nr:Mitogen-activated protein kinase kinase kinase 7 [Dissophora globulifera]
MTVPVSHSVDHDVLQVLQQSAPRIPFEEIDHIIYDVYIPGRYGNLHTGQWKGNEVEIREPFGDPSTIEREVRLLYKLGNSCPQIQRLHGFTIDPATSIPYIVVQHNEHGTLHSYLLNFHPHLTWSDRYNLALDVALGLRYIHYKGYRHRHLHSASVLIDANGSAILSDFGSTRDAEVISSREHKARMAYIAPERLTKNGTRYSIECDIYALGMVLWEISSGRLPFESLIVNCSAEDGTLVSLAQDIVAGRREHPVGGTDPVYEDLYTRCWHPNPLERPSLDWVIQTLGVLLKKPSGSNLRHIEDLTLEEQPKKPAYSAKASFRDSHGSSTSHSSHSVKSSRSHSIHSIDDDRSHSSPMLRSGDLIMSPRESEYSSSTLPAAPLAPPVSQRRKMSAVSSSAPSIRSMSISSGSSSGSSSNGGGPAIPTRDSRRVSTLSSSSSVETSKYDVIPKRRTPQTIWEACQEGNVDLTEWYLLTNGADPNGLISLPAYSMLAEVAPIHVACYHQPESLMAILKVLQRHGAVMQLVTTITHQSALHIMLEHATNYNLTLEICSFLMQDCKLSVNDQDSRGVTPFHKFLKNPHLSARPSVAGSELYTLLRDRGEASLNIESYHEGNALGMAARYLRADLLKLFLLTDLSCSEPRSLAYALDQVEAPLSETRPSKALQDLCRAMLLEWTGERGEAKRIQMAERILEHQERLTTGSPTSTLSHASGRKGHKQSTGLLSIGKSKKHKDETSMPALPAKAANEVEVARKILRSTITKQQKLKTVMAQSGF